MHVFHCLNNSLFSYIIHCQVTSTIILLIVQVTKLTTFHKYHYIPTFCTKFNLHNYEIVILDNQGSPDGPPSHIDCVSKDLCRVHKCHHLHIDLVPLASKTESQILFLNDLGRLNSSNLLIEDTCFHEASLELRAVEVRCCRSCFFSECNGSQVTQVLKIEVSEKGCRLKCATLDEVRTVAPI